MRKILLLLGCIIIFSATTANAQILSPVAQAEGTFDPDSQVFFIGQTSISGIFQGFPLEILAETPFHGEISAFPIIGSSHFSEVDEVIIGDIVNLENQTLENITDFNEDLITRFSGVTLTVEDGFFLLGTLGGRTELQSTLSFAICTVLNLEIIENTQVPSLVILTTSPLSYKQTGQQSLFLPVTDNGTVTITSAEGERLWSGDIQGKFVFINDPSFIISQDTPVYLFPVFSQGNDDAIELEIQPADTTSADVSPLLEELSETTPLFGSMPDFIENLQGFEPLITTVSAVVNGGMIIVESNDTILIDDTSQSFSHIGFARANKYEVSFQPDTLETSVQGEYRMIFLGDHLYTARAPNSDDGIAFPFILVFIWVLALCLYFLFHFYIKKSVDEEFDKKIKRYSYVFHIIMLILAFILMDREISYQFGISAIDAVLGQGVSVVFGAFILIEVIIWALGFVVLALPVRIIVNSLLLYRFGIGKGGKAIGKGIGALSIWVFCALYVKMIINVILLLISPSVLFPMG